MQNLIHSAKKKKQKKSPPSEQKSFNNLKSKIENLELEIRALSRELDILLETYQKELAPQERTLSSLIQKKIQLLYFFYTKKKLFHSRDKKILKAILESSFENLSYLVNPLDFDEEIKEIHENLFKITQVDVEKAAEEFQEELEQLFNSRKGSKESDFVSEPEASPKEILEKKSLNTIYRQLAKALHPDLEQDPIKKEEKLEEMKKLTMAYEEGDIHTLLKLKVEHVSSEKPEEQNDLKIYNNLLRKKLESLEIQKQTLYLSPRYRNILFYVSQGPSKAKHLMKQRVAQNKNLIPFEQLILKNLQGSRAVATIHELIELYIEEIF
jgi:hypothetical protein